MAFDTKTVELHEDDMDFVGDDGFDWSEAQVTAAVNLAFEQTDIGKQSKFKNHGSSDVIKDVCTSKVAYIESEMGYFVLSAGFLQHVVVTYHRWDQFNYMPSRIWARDAAIHYAIPNTC